MSITCQNCKHWRKIRDENYMTAKGDMWLGPHGECNAIDEFSLDKSAWLSYFLGPKDVDKPEPENASVDVSLITKPDFSCPLGESK